MGSLSREPLVHFTLIGAVLFVVHGWLNPATGAAVDTAREIHIGEAHLAWLSTTWSRQWHRPPAQDELRGLLADFVREELFAREARELGLDRDDTVVNRRLAQKLAFLVEDTAQFAQPGEGELEAFHRANRARFRTPARRSFEQIHFNPAQRADAMREAADVREGLVRGAGMVPVALGDRSLLESRLDDLDEQAVAAQFGPTFASAVFALPVGEWSGPLTSAYGVHLVRVSAERAARERPYPEIRHEVAAAWREQRRIELAADHYARLLAKYEIILDEPARQRVGEWTPLPAATARAPQARP